MKAKGMPPFRCIVCHRDPTGPSYGKRTNKSVVCRYCKARGRAQIRRWKREEEP